MNEGGRYAFECVGTECFMETFHPPSVHEPQMMPMGTCIETQRKMLVKNGTHG